jgi:hypothetical protein
LRYPYNEWQRQVLLDHTLNAANNALRKSGRRRPEGVEASNIVSIGSLFSSASERAIARRERDHDRGYSINVKQVVLAFVVEFFIIGLILVGQYLIAEDVAKEKAFSILLFPIGLAIVELGRVPLAIAVRTQNAWSLKCLAGLGVAAAVVVTSFSLSTIAYQTFDPRLADVNQKSNILHDLQATKTILVNEIGSAANVVKEKRSDRDSVSQRFNELQSQISKLSTAKGQSCSTTTNADGVTTKHCTTVAAVNRAQLKTLQDQLVNTKKELEEAESALGVAEASLAKLDLRPIDEKIAKAQNDYRIAIGRSQLHSYTSMIMRKAPGEVTESEIKSLESYLIFIPSIAAALASTLLAITAVRRIRRSAETVTTISDALVEVIKKQAEDAVAAAMAKKDNFSLTAKNASG